jgi:iron(III) transport system permease protein
MWTQALLNSILIYGMVLALSLPCSILVAIVLSRTQLPGRRVLGILLFSTMAIPVYVQAGAWNSIFGEFGWWKLTQVGAIQNGWWSGFAVCFIQTAYVFPWMTAALCYGLRHSNSNAEENAWLDVGAVSTLCRFTLPMLGPYILLSMLIAFTLLSTDMTVTNLYRVDTITERFYQQASAGEITGQTLAMPVLLGFSLFAILAILAWCRGWFIDFALSSSREEKRIYDREFKFPIPTSAMILWGSLTWGVVIFLTLVPQLNLVWTTGLQSKTIGSEAEGAGTWSATRLLINLWQTPQEFSSEFGWSIYLGICSATFWLISALLLSFCWGRRPWLQKLGGAVLLLLIFTPGPLAGLASIYLWNRNWPTLFGWLYDQTLTAPVTALGVRMFPLAVAALVIVRNLLPAACLQVAAVDGIAAWRLWFSWYVKHFHALFAAWIVLFLLSVADLSAILLVLPPGVTPISTRIFELLHYGVRYQESGICPFLSTASMAGALIAYLLSAYPKTTSRRH